MTWTTRPDSTPPVTSLTKQISNLVMLIKLIKYYQRKSNRIQRWPLWEKSQFNTWCIPILDKLKFLKDVERSNEFIISKSNQNHTYQGNPTSVQVIELKQNIEPSKELLFTVCWDDFDKIENTFSGTSAAWKSMHQKFRFFCLKS